MKESYDFEILQDAFVAVLASRDHDGPIDLAKAKSLLLKEGNVSPNTASRYVNFIAPKLAMMGNVQVKGTPDDLSDLPERLVAAIAGVRNSLLGLEKLASDVWCETRQRLSQQQLHDRARQLQDHDEQVLAISAERDDLAAQLSSARESLAGCQARERQLDETCIWTQQQLKDVIAERDAQLKRIGVLEEDLRALRLKLDRLERDLESERNQRDELVPLMRELRSTLAKRGQRGGRAKIADTVAPTPAS